MYRKPSPEFRYSTTVARHIRLTTRPRQWLGDMDATAGVRYIAEHAPGVSMDDVFEFMSEHTGIADFDGKAMGGRMSAVGFGRNSIGGGVGPLYETDTNSRKYRMDERLARALLEMDANVNEN